MRLEQYQDIWINGAVDTPGIRECANRYEHIRAIAAQYERPFTVLDVGANLGYFSIRLTEDFPNCRVVAIEHLYSKWLIDVLAANNTYRIVLLDHQFTVDDLKRLGEVEHFDMVLAMSVMHHFDQDWGSILAAFRQLGDVLIAETAHEQAACGRNITETCEVPADAELLALFPSHLDGSPRPMWTTSQPRTTLAKAYLDTPMNDCNIRIEADNRSKQAVKGKKRYDWFPGINLHTWLRWGGSWPERHEVAEMVRESAPAKRHGDIRTHNVILSGDATHFIDAADPRRAMDDDAESLHRLLLEIDGRSV